jgi:hypothetical protein
MEAQWPQMTALVVLISLTIKKFIDLLWVVMNKYQIVIYF